MHDLTLILSTVIREVKILNVIFDFITAFSGIVLELNFIYAYHKILNGHLLGNIVGGCRLTPSCFASSILLKKAHL